MKSKFLKVVITLLIAAFIGLAAGCSGGGSDVTSSSGGSTTGGTLTGSGQ